MKTVVTVFERACRAALAIWSMLPLWGCTHLIVFRFWNGLLAPVAHLKPCHDCYRSLLQLRMGRIDAKSVVLLADEGPWQHGCRLVMPAQIGDTPTLIEEPPSRLERRGG